MAFFNRFQKNTLALSVLAATLTLAGCGGGSSGGSNTAADLQVVLTQQGSLTSNGVVTYSVRVSNNAKNSVTGAILSLPKLTGLTKLSAKCRNSTGGCTATTTPTIEQLEKGFALPTLAEGQVYELNVVQKITAAANTMIEPAATVTLPSGFSDSKAADNSSTAKGTVTAAVLQDVAIEFTARAGDLPIKCGEKIANIGTTSATVELKDLRFYISDLHLMNAADEEIPVTLDSNEWQAEGVALVDLEDGAGACAGNTLKDASGNPLPNTIHAVITGKAPVDNYTGVGYTVGVPHAINHSAYDRAPFDIQSMGWGWQAGRRFLKLEINPDAKVTKGGTQRDSFMIHLGAGDCTGDPIKGEIVTCGAPNRMAYHSHSFDLKTQKIAVDINNFFATSNVTVDNGGALGCMSGKTDPECPVIFDKLKIDLTTGQPLDGGHGQGLFKVVSK